MDDGPQNRPVPTTGDEIAFESADKLFRSIQAVFPAAVSNFEDKWIDWLVSCRDNSSDPEAPLPETASSEYEALKALGPKIIPFVVHKLAQSDDQYLIGVQLYKDLATDNPYVAASLEGPLNSTEILQRHADSIVWLHRERYAAFLWAAKVWQQRAEQEAASDGSWDATDCEEYRDLLEMGPSVIAPAMVEYSKSDLCPWHELLHEVIHGQKIGGQARLDYRPLFLKWFVEREHKDAPRFVQSDEDQDMRCR